MKILITGSNGLLGQKLLHKLRLDKNIDLHATSIGDNRVTVKEGYAYHSLDITNKQEVYDLIDKIKPNVILNTAAMTNVDECEIKRDECENININSVKYLVSASKDFNSHIIHISTDFIYDGKKGFYSEEDKANPLSFYGLSKLRSEDFLKSTDCKWTIIRTIVVYGVTEKPKKNNIILWAKKSLEEGKEISVVKDQFRAPTFAEDLADACIAAFKKKKYGIFNVSSEEIISIYDIVLRVAKFYNLNTGLIKKISTKDLNQRAVRPYKTGFVLNKAKELLNYSPHSIEESLIEITKQLKKI